MSTLRRTLTLHRWPAAWLVALAIVVRLLVPAGYMPMAGTAGLEICAGQVTDMPVPSAMASTGDGGAMHAMPMMHAASGKAMDHDSRPMSGEGDHNCAFAAVGGAVQLATMILPVPIAPMAMPVLLVRQAIARPGLGLAAPPPPKTGPPSILR